MKVLHRMDIKRLSKPLLTAVPVVLSAATVFSTVAIAQSLDSATNAVSRKLQTAQASQNRVDQLDSERRDLYNQYKAANRTFEDLSLYNRLKEKEVKEQQIRIDGFQAQFDEVTATQRQIIPLMISMVDALEEFVQLDVPFKINFRENRIQGLRDVLDRPEDDVTNAEKFRQVIERYNTEMEYGNTIETYSGNQQVNGQDLPVDYLRVGRVFYGYVTKDGSQGAVWNNTERSWQPVSDAVRQNMVDGIAMADQRTPIDLLTLPVQAPEAAQ